MPRGGLHRHFQTLSSAPSLADDQCCAYIVSMLRTMELREMAVLELGPKCSLAAFHDVVLQAASVPLAVLTQGVSLNMRSRTL